MKKYLLIVFLSYLSVTIFSQNTEFPIDSISGEILYSEIIQVQSKTQDQLYLSARDWFMSSFISSQNVVDVDDKGMGIIYGKGNINVHLSIAFKGDAGYVNFVVRIEVKEGRYRYSFTEFEHRPGTTEIFTHGDLRQEKPLGGFVTMGMKNWSGIREQTNTAILEMIGELKKRMGTVNKDDKW